MRSVSVLRRLAPPARFVHARTAPRLEHEHGEHAVRSGPTFQEAPKETAKKLSPVVSAEEFRRREDITLRMPPGVPPLDPIQSFETAPDTIKRASTMIKKFPQPTSIQAQAWPVALAGHDLISIARTGSGKTLGFLIPGLNYIASLPRPKGGRYGPAVLVIAPTRELAVQIEAEARLYTNFPTVCAYGGVSKSPQIRGLAEGVDILIGTPGRLNDILSMDPPVTNLNRVGYVVLDEADRMLDMGFEPQLRQILSFMPQGQKRQTLMFSATWPKEVQSLAMAFLNNPAQINIGGLDLNVNPDIEQKFHRTSSGHEKANLLVSTLNEIRSSRGPSATFMIFCNTKNGCEQIGMWIKEKTGIRCHTLHGDKSQEQRDYALREFRTASAPVIVCTDVAARGLDIKNVTAVINYDFPNGGVQDWIHRVGRTGRSGVKGLAITFFNPVLDEKHATELAELLNKASQSMPDWMRPMVRLGSAPVPKKGYTPFGGGGRRNDFIRRGDRNQFGNNFGGNFGGFPRNEEPKDFDAPRRGNSNFSSRGRSHNDFEDFDSPRGSLNDGPRRDEDEAPPRADMLERNGIRIINRR